MKRCKICGGNCDSIGGGNYQCDCCGRTYCEEDFAVKSKAQAAPIVQPASEKISGADIFEQNINGVLEVSTSSGMASGYLISADGFAITNAHAVYSRQTFYLDCSVKIAGQVVHARVLHIGAEDEEEFCTNNDLALLKLDDVPSGAKPLTLGDYKKIRTGETVYVIGNSLGEGTCITSGIISDKDRHGQLMYDSATNPGNSGGPVFNSDGLVIGTHVAGTSPNGMKVQGMNIAIPISAVEDFIGGTLYNVKVVKK